MLVQESQGETTGVHVTWQQQRWREEGDSEKCQEHKGERSLLRGPGHGSNPCTRTSIKKTRFGEEGLVEF